MPRKLIVFSILSILTLTAAAGIVFGKQYISDLVYKVETANEPVTTISVKPNPTGDRVEEAAANETAELEIPSRKTLDNNYHIFQTFNNCGPASFSMALSYYGINVSQQELGQALRPYQNPQGDNDDKSVTLEEVAQMAKKYDLIAYRRPNGNENILKLFIANDIPVITRTWLKVDDDIGHYRLVKGYDDTRGLLIQDDSLQGKNLRYSYDEFNAIWKKFNYEYLVLVPKDKEQIALQIMGEDADFDRSWEKAAAFAESELQNDPNDVDMRFNYSVALYNTGKYRESTQEFEKVQGRLSRRTLWYQIEPIRAYYELEEYGKVISITDNILSNGNRAFSELYVIRGDIYKKQGDAQRARAEYEKAVQYNVSFEEAKERLASLE